MRSVLEARPRLEGLGLAKTTGEDPKVIFCWQSLSTFTDALLPWVDNQLRQTYDSTAQ